MNYKSAYEKTAAFFNARPKAKKCLLLSNYLVTGLFFLAYGGLGLLGIYSHLALFYTDRTDHKLVGMGNTEIESFAIIKIRPSARAFFNLQPICALSCVRKKLIKQFSAKPAKLLLISVGLSYVTQIYHGSRLRFLQYYYKYITAAQKMQHFFIFVALFGT